MPAKKAKSSALAAPASLSSPAPSSPAADLFKVVDIRRHHGDYDVVTAENAAIVARRGPLGKAQQLKFWAEKAYLEVGDLLSLAKV